MYLYGIGNKVDVTAPEFIHWADDGTVITVDKIGGGTLPKSYEGGWLWQAYDADGVLIDGGKVVTGTPHTHAWVAGFVSVIPNGGLIMATPQWDTINVSSARLGKDPQRVVFGPEGNADVVWDGYRMVVRPDGEIVLSTPTR